MDLELGQPIKSSCFGAYHDFALSSFDQFELVTLKQEFELGALHCDVSPGFIETQGELELALHFINSQSLTDTEGTYVTLTSNAVYNLSEDSSLQETAKCVSYSKAFGLRSSSCTEEALMLCRSPCELPLSRKLADGKGGVVFGIFLACLIGIILLGFVLLKAKHFLVVKDAMEVTIEDGRPIQATGRPLEPSGLRLSVGTRMNVKNRLSTFYESNVKRRTAESSTYSEAYVSPIPPGM